MAKIISKRGRDKLPPKRAWPFPSNNPQIIHHDEDEPPEDWIEEFADDEEVLRKTTEGVIVDHNWVETEYD